MFLYTTLSTPNMAENKLGLNWSAVERALAEGTFSGYKIGILETEKLLVDFLNRKQIPGGDTERKMKYVHHFLSMPDKLDYSRHIYERILNEPHYEISRDETKQVISGYWQAMLDIEEAVQALNRWQKISMRLKYVRSSIVRQLRFISLGILGISLLIWVLGETGPGRQAGELLVKINHFFIFKILFWMTVILLSLLLLGAIFYFLTRKKRKF